VDVAGQSCTSCHGDPTRNDPAPPLGTRGESSTTQRAVGAHAAHLGASAWHRDGRCEDCHPVPTSLGHPNAVVDLAFGGPSVAAGAVPVFSAADLACSDVYCHGSKLRGPKPGGTVQRSPAWTRVDGTFQACGASCHTNPPGGDHPTHPDCRICHQAVITSFDPGTNAATWADRAKHVNGIVEHNKYHNLPGWTSPRGNPDHHGSTYFLTRQQQDEHGAACTQCHGADLQGGSVAVSCNNLTCHGGQDWRSCTFCHGTPPGQANPPTGVGGETTTGTLAVGRHAAHLTASSTHAAFTCQTCHAVPPAGDVSHALGYVPTSGLGTAGHHGDVTFAGPAAGMTFNVNATQGAPVTARGSCAGACHSNGRGGAPLVTAYWAGGTWTTGSCSSCHAASPTTGEHGAHRGELGCTGCHPAASSSSHLNGQRDVNAVIAGPQGGSVSVTPPGGPCGTRVTCTGTCHGEGHTNRCW
jgi:predicted CxxxxCH...CXXCH cytochrome family protein